MKKLVLILILLIPGIALIAQSANSCDYELKGIVLDAETKEVLPFVQVAISGTQLVALTDINGEFHLTDLCEESHSLSISCLGYCDTTCHLHHHISETPYIYLKQQASILDAVTISAEREREEGTESIAQLSLGKDELSANVTQSLASALSDIDGLTFTSVGSNVQLPVIHGLYGNRVLILNNGIKHGFQNWGSDHAPEIDIATANRITVLKGAAGVRYGPEAIGGAIVVEADPLNFNQPFSANIGTGYQTNGRGYFVNAGLAQGGERLSYHLGANYTRIGDRNTPDYSLTNSGKEERSINGGLRYRLNDNLDVKVYYSYLSQNLGILRSSIAETGESLTRALNADEPNFIRPFSYDINEPRQFIQHHLGKVETSWRYAEDAKLTFRVGTQINQREEYDVRRNSELPIIDLDLITNDIQLEWEHPEWLGLDGLVGFQVFTQNNDNNPGTRTTAFIPNYNTFRVSAFFVESLKNNNNTFELGVRFDHENNNVRGRETNQDLFTDDYNFTNVTASLGYVRNISANTTFRTNLAMAWRTPNMAELFSFGQHGFKTSFGLLRYYFDENEGGRVRTDRVPGLF
ncbi:MAG: TonB-dependent receptor, partial [Bacteroidota bacterium]